MAPPGLLGPPELHRNQPTPQPHTTGNAFVDLLVSHFNSSPLAGRLPMGFTENHSPTFLSSGNPCLDFFFHVVPDTPAPSLTERVSQAWAHDPLTTLKLIFNLRGVRGKGKTDREGFYTAAFWLHKHHPRTLASNVASFADFGCFKDLPEILYRLLEGSDVRKIQRTEWLQKKGVKCKRINDHLRIFSRERNMKRSGRGRGRGRGKRGRGGRGGNTEIKKKSAVPREIRVSNAAERAKKEEEAARKLREEKKIAMAKKVVERYANDSNFRFLYEKITDHFAESLKADLEFLKREEYGKISLSAKWCPSLDSLFDRATLLCESTAKKVFPREFYSEYEGIEEAHYAYRVRDRLRKEVLVPLRKALELPEVFIGANQWDQLPYNRVASVAMKFYKEKFLNHDGERFKKYLEDVKAGKAKIAAGALLPHEIINSLGDEDCRMVGELQWKRMVEDMRKSGKLRNCIAVSDVSRSMEGDPMEVSVALGLLVSELSEDPWKGKIITFSADPQVHVIKGDDLKSKMEFVKKMEWGRSTNFQKVFDLILQVAVRGNLKEEEMIKRVFVFSDMEFDRASPNNWETDYDVITRKFSEKGYGKVVPEMVFWNLRDSASTPAPGKQKGVALVSGFSKNLIKVFLDNNGEIDPESIMKTAISGKEYERLVVVD